jgi:CTD nuclear envelope phosphatase 1
MNALNKIAARVSPHTTPAPTRTNSLSALGLAAGSDDHERPSSDLIASEKNVSDEPESYDDHVPADTEANEKTPLLNGESANEVRSSIWHRIPRQIASGCINSLRWLLSTLAAPGVYLIALLYDPEGNFAPLLRLKRLFGYRKTSVAYERSPDPVSGDREGELLRGTSDMTASTLSSSSSPATSDSESELSEKGSRRSSTSHRSRTTEEIAPGRRSIRIRLHNDEALRQKKQRRAEAKAKAAEEGGSGDLAAQLKSPTSPAGALTKYPKTPAPPRPLIPRRQPSYIAAEPSLHGERHLKTLILDLDETLIHSMSKGGRMGSGHMVEVRLNTTYVVGGGQAAVGPQHPILYYVYKRPHCDDFLRRVRHSTRSILYICAYTDRHQISKWYNLVIFTASVQEYADPVIDWLESERKFFSRRFYRQDCTQRQNAYIKDLSKVEADLSKVMILDNSPLSYMFHQGKSSFSATQYANCC